MGNDMSDENVIDVSNLTKSFDGRVAVDQVSIKIKAGEIYGFLGPNGSGKTTTIRLICGLLTPDSGGGYCLGYDILKQAQIIKTQVGYMTQNFSLYDEMSVYENLDFIARLYELDDRPVRVNDAMDFIGIPKERHHQLAGTLSGGWRQRLALAAAILHKPKLLLLDEPTAGVDPKARRQFWDQIHHLSDEGITTLVSTHYMDEAERCDQLAYLSFGKIISQGTPVQMIERAKIKTWRVCGPDLDHLADKLRQEPGVLLVANFGRSLHVSGVDEQQLLAVISKFKVASYKWVKIQPSLEDVFIYYMTIHSGGNQDE